MRSQKLNQRVTLAPLHGTTEVVEGSEDHLDRDPLQRFLQGLRHLLAGVIKSAGNS